MFDRTKMFTVQSNEVAEYRPYLEPLVKEIEARSDFITSDDVFSQASRAEAQLWAYAERGKPRAVVATRIYEMERGRVCLIWVAVGKDALDVLLAMHDEIEAWASSIGCVALEIVGREGWTKKLDGYRKTAAVYEKRLKRVN